LKPFTLHADQRVSDTLNYQRIRESPRVVCTALCVFLFIFSTLLGWRDIENQKIEAKSRILVLRPV